MHLQKHIRASASPIAFLNGRELEDDNLQNGCSDREKLYKQIGKPDAEKDKTNQN